MAVHVLTGDDESILRSAVGSLVQQLVGDGVFPAPSGDWPAIPWPAF